MSTAANPPAADDVTLTEAEWGAIQHSLYDNEGDIQATVERIIAARLAAVEVES